MAVEAGQRQQGGEKFTTINQHVLLQQVVPEPGPLERS